MDSRVATLAGTPNEPEFNCIQFEKRLMQLKDSQDSINSLSAWCLENRQHHKKIVNAWLNVLKKVKVEQRLTLFYLANDVIQYSKRKSYDFVASWGTTLQKATTMVREEKVKTRILRIFKIWEQRGIYGEEFITDLSGLISASPALRKLDQDPQDFQPQYLMTRIRSCAKLESETDTKMKQVKDTKLKIMDTDALCASLKDRGHVDEIEKEVEQSITVIEGYVSSLKAEIKSRNHLVSVLGQAETFYNTERKEVKVVVSAYKNFTTRVKNLKRKLDELMPTLSSPIPSPDVNAPSPEPDSDIDLPNNEVQDKLKCSVAAGVSVYSMTETYNPGYYTPATTQNQQNFANNGFSSFMGSNIPFDIQNFNTTGMFGEQTHTETYSDMQHHLPGYNTPESVSQQPPYNQSINQVPGYNQTAVNQGGYNQQSQPLLPPPMPPFTTSGYMDTTPYTDTTYASSTNTYTSNSTYQAVGSAPYAVTAEIQTSYQPTTDAYNPEEDVETWEPEAVWNAPPDLETPESPPMFEKEGFADPIEYDDSKSGHTGLSMKDVDHRVLITSSPGLGDTDHRMNRLNSTKDVDHRNLISLTGSPGNEPGHGLLQPPPAPPTLWPVHGDQDYRALQDQDYRVSADIAQQLKLPPPPPPPSTKSPLKKPCSHDNVESIDMELSDDESSSVIQTQNNTSNSSAGGGSVQHNIVNSSPLTDTTSHVTNNNRRHRVYGNKKIPTLVGNSPATDILEPPPPIPENLCEIPTDGTMTTTDAFSKGNLWRPFSCSKDTWMNSDVKTVMHCKLPELQYIAQIKYSDLYKALPIFDQNKRREELLAEQKRRRENLVDEARGLCDVSVANAPKPHRNRIAKEFSNKLMLSEWMTEVPDDLSDLWWLKFCPKGHRNLIVAHKNITKAYSKCGRLERVFRSAFPGSKGGCNSSKYKMTILDAIYNSESNCFYILDILMWADYSLVDCDVEFRFFWLQSKMMEIPELQTINSANAHAFHYVSHVPCDLDSLRLNLNKFPFYENNAPCVDGVLFYHREASYVSGRTPLVGWLKPYMVPEILSIQISNDYLCEKPAHYQNLNLHIKYARQRKQKKFREVAMDTC
ncbi:uncharacterized protein CBL_03755 [Carabus blaptoides fortunei]